MDEPQFKRTHPAGAAAAGSETRRLPEALGRRYLLGFDTDELAQRRSDVLVVGSGMAGLTAALGAAATGRTVNLVTKARITETNTWYAQGGIAGAVGEADSVELHLADTLVVGAGLCDEDVVLAVVEEAALALSDLAAREVTRSRASCTRAMRPVRRSRTRSPRECGAPRT
jgi:succinate dehydrogenase/fumarate reductase flavoprotein subunit